MTFRNRQNQRSPDLSVVVPFFNEEENVVPLHRVLSRTLETANLSHEVIYVDDGSRDATFARLRQISAEDSNVLVIKLRNNFGQSAAMAAGFARARGEVIVTMDGDLQNDPRDIPRLLEKLDEGYDIVSGWRKHRQDKLLVRKVPSRIANSLIRFLTGVKLHDTGCALKAYRREIIERISLYGELHRFIPALGRIEGARIGEIIVSHHPRRFGRSKYNLMRTFKVIMDLITLNLLLKYIASPLRFFGLLGAFFTTGSFATLLAMSYGLATGLEASEINVLLAVTFLFIVSGIQFLLYGLLSNMVVKTGQRSLSRLHHLINS